MDFDERYYSDNYGGRYDLRNPPRKTSAILDEISKHCPGGRLMDVGCAYGAFLQAAADSGRYQLWGTDVSEHAIEIARERLTDHDVSLQAGGLFDSGGPPRSFDVVTLFDVIEHIDNLGTSFGAIRDLLQDGGLLALTVPVYDGPLGGLVSLLDNDPTHLHKVSRWDWVERVQAGGFQVLEWSGLYRYPVLGRFYFHRRSRRFRDFAPAILILARLREGARG